jgi:hypothetical protein
MMFMMPIPADQERDGGNTGQQVGHGVGGRGQDRHHFRLCADEEVVISARRQSMTLAEKRRDRVADAVE